MEQVEEHLTCLCTRHGKKGYDAVNLLYRIISNIVENNGDSKYLSLNMKTNSLKNANNFKEFVATMTIIGFKKRVCDFQEFLKLEQHINSIFLMKLQDINVIVSNILDKYENSYTTTQPISVPISFMELKRQRIEKEKLWKKISDEAEQDRLEKIRKENVINNKLRLEQERSKQQQIEAMESLREMRKYEHENKWL